MPEENNKITLEDLATMVKNGFDEIGGKLENLEQGVKELKHGHEEIRLKLDNVAYRFELVELQKRVDVLEKKANINHVE